MSRYPLRIERLAHEAGDLGPEAEADHVDAPQLKGPEGLEPPEHACDVRPDDPRVAHRSHVPGHRRHLAPVHQDHVVVVAKEIGCNIFVSRRKAGPGDVPARGVESEHIVWRETFQSSLWRSKGAFFPRPAAPR